MNQQTNKQRFSLRKRVNSFKYAVDGLKVLLAEEHNARIHMVVAVLVVIFGFIMDIGYAEWGLLLFTIGFVLVAEIFNTCVEAVCDVLCPEKDIRIKKIKDLAALAVLVAAVVAVAVGCLVFLPRLVSWLVC
ncbi:diacylglycerol kinase family protein [Pelobium manganitolerans]|uniref:diacylglycerol kinase family protein n=1 Tax=Pelobium manganitolerans TaxID=1842495 RepID=UPI003FA3693B